MSTIKEFKNAPVGATATSPDGHIAFKTGRLKFPWSIYDSHGTHLDNLCSAEMVGYTLNPVVPTNSQEALELAWELAHPVKEWQVIPAGTRYLEKRNHGLIKECTADRLTALSDGLRTSVRTLDPPPDPLPEPEPDTRPLPDWVDAPAVLTTCGCHGTALWHPRNKKDGTWECTHCGLFCHWSGLVDVTPLYPKEGQDK